MIALVAVAAVIGLWFVPSSRVRRCRGADGRTGSFQVQLLFRWFSHPPGARFAPPLRTVVCTTRLTKFGGWGLTGVFTKCWHLSPGS
jgi:hypothetical protein